AAELALDDQFAAVVFVRFAQEQRCGEVPTDADRRTREREDRVVDMVAVGAGAGIAVEARRQDLQRQSRGDEAADRAQAFEDGIADLQRQRIVLGQLLIRLYAGSDVARGVAAVLPVRA